LGALGAGYPMYYALKKNLIWCLVILAVIYGIPMTVMIGLKIWKTGDINGITKTIPKISTVNFYLADSEWGQFVYGDVVMYLNCVAIVYLIIHSIYMRRMLLKLKCDIDEEEVTASDFVVLARGLPKNLT
jgi:hypothetical protein